eukprot:13490132-Alexandrium_andersonii.AAC.1
MPGSREKLLLIFEGGGACWNKLTWQARARAPIREAAKWAPPDSAQKLCTADSPGSKQTGLPAE